MKILYGVQGTGNGHITRARAMAKYLNEYGAQITFLFSGRKPDEYFDMQIFGRCLYRKGLSIALKNGAINYPKTATSNSPGTFIREIRQLDLDGFDLVITDFEPIVAWAARSAGAPCLGIGHQYAFKYDIPKSGVNFAAQALFNNFAPATYALGLHWHHFNTPILPPIISPPALVDTPPEQANKILVYLPFENQRRVIETLKQFPDYRFLVYTNHYRPGNERNICVFRQSRAHFQKSLSRCAGVICNAGFELGSEALLLGKKLLVKPVKRQMEQASNVLALQVLQLADCMDHINHIDLKNWLDRDNSVRIHYPDVAKAIVEWLHLHPSDNSLPLSQTLWQST